MSTMASQWPCVRSYRTASHYHQTAHRSSQEPLDLPRWIEPLHYYRYSTTTMPSKTASDLCCAHPSRALSPTEPARPAIISLDGIFAVAALPEDHPHALKMPERRPGSKLAKTLIKSPSVVGKLKGQLRRRKTIRSLKAEMFDDDARRIGSEEVLEAVERAEGAGK